MSLEDGFVLEIPKKKLLLFKKLYRAFYLSINFLYEGCECRW